MVVYLKHPVHGSKVAISEAEIAHDVALGWEIYDPEVAAPVPEVPEAPKAPKGRKPKETEVPSFLQ